MVLTGWFENFCFFLFFLSLWLLPSGLLMTCLAFLFFYDSSIWAETCMVMCSVHVKLPLLFSYCSFLIIAFLANGHGIYGLS